MTNTPAQDSGSCSVDLSMSEISESTVSETTDEVFTTVIETVEQPEAPSGFSEFTRFHPAPGKLEDDLLLKF